MGRHVAHSVLVRVFSGQASEPEVAAAVPHLARCQRCWGLAVRVIAELKTVGRLARNAEAPAAVLLLVEEEQAQALSRLRARACWADLRRLPPLEQLARIEADPALRSLEIFRTVSEKAAQSAREDPYLGEEIALFAHTLAAALPGDLYPEPFRNDLQSEALALLANCRRMVGDWRGSAAAFAEAKSHLQKGTGEAVREAHLLSLQASLATDTGRLEQALNLLEYAVLIYRAAQDDEALASVLVQKASTLLAACRYEEAILQAEEALQCIDGDARLEMLARSIVTESLVFLGSADKALRSFSATRSLYSQLCDPRTELLEGYIGALLLDALGYTRESDKAFRNNIDGFMDAELYKDAFLTLVTFLQSLVRRGALDKAARVCETALIKLDQAGPICHSQMPELWRGLLAAIEARRLTEGQLLAARDYLVRHWNSPAHQVPLEWSGKDSGSPAVEAFASISQQRLLSTAYGDAGSALERQSSQRPSERPVEVTDLSQRGYEEALEHYERGLILAGLAKCGGRINQTAQLLGIARNTLRARIEKYNLASVAPDQSNDTQRAAEDSQVLSRLRALAWWAELKRLPHRQQLEQLQAVASIQTREMFETILAEASAVALHDPHQGQELALLAHSLAGLMPRSRCSEPERNGFQAASLLIVANCRRLMGDWPGSANALGKARTHLLRGSGEEARLARLFSLEASLASDLEKTEQALALLAQAAALYGRARDPVAAASVIIQESSILLAAGRHQEALSRAEQSLRLLPPNQTRLEMLARSIVTESLVFLGRREEALHSFHATQPLYDVLHGLRTEHLRKYLEALLLEAFGYVPEAEAAFRENISGFMDAGHYKDAFLTALTYFAALFRRGALDKAARACAETLALLEEAGEDFHAPMKELFRTLLVLVQAQHLTERHLLEARHYLVRSGHARAPHVLRDGGDTVVAVALPSWVTGAEPTEPPPATKAEASALEIPPPDRWLEVLTPPDPETSLDEVGYKEALARYDRQLIVAGLAQAKGDIRQASRLLGIPRNRLRHKLRRYFLSGRES